jgi:hypothetical protein
MGEERQPHFRAEPAGSASRDARKAIISAWAAGARPLRHGHPADYERMRQLMSAYLDTTFPEVPAASRLDAVNRALASIVAYENVQPEELIEALDDAGLHPSGRTPDERHRDDERVARLAFGATTTGVGPRWPDSPETARRSSSRSSRCISTWSTVTRANRRRQRKSWLESARCR